MFSEIGITELLLVLGIVFVFFGARRLPELGASLGKGIREFRRGVAGATADDRADGDEADRPPTRLRA